jgi:CelD/BcsL family acetyltransferase involved in cellulose biosynthesis
MKKEAVGQDTPAPPHPRWEIHRLGQGLGIHKSAWNDLNAALCDSTPYFDSDFIENLLKHFAKGGERLCLHKNGDGTVDGMLIVEPSAWGKWSIFSPAQTQIGALLVRDARVLASLFAELPGLAWSLDCPCQDLLYEPLTGMAQELPLCSVEHVLTLSVAIDGHFEDYWRSRPRRLRQNMGRYMRRLRADGLSLRTERTSAPDDMPLAVQRYGMLESSGRKERDDTEAHIENAQDKFHGDLMADFARRGKALAYALYFNDTLVAMRLCILSDDMMVMLKTAYDERYAEYAPDRLLLYFLLAEEFERGQIGSVEFYAKAKNDEVAWATHERPVMHFQLFKSQAMKSVYILARCLRQALSPAAPRPSGEDSTLDELPPQELGY